MASAATTMVTTAPSIPSAIASLQSFSSALGAFTSAWRLLESDLSAIDGSLTSRIAVFIPPEVAELWRLCAGMDGVGLRSYLIKHRGELKDPVSALDAALLSAPDPGLLVLVAAAGFCRSPAEGETDGDVKMARRAFLDLLDRLRALGVRTSPAARAEARAVPAEWLRSLDIGKQALYKETIAFLLLVGVFGLVQDGVDTDEVLELVVAVSSRERAVEAFVDIGLDLDVQMPVLIQKMKSKGRQLEAVKFIQALSLAHKFPLLPVLRSYMTDAAKAGNQICNVVDNSEASQNAIDI